MNARGRQPRVARHIVPASGADSCCKRSRGGQVLLEDGQPWRRMAGLTFSMPREPWRQPAMPRSIGVARHKPPVGGRVSSQVSPPGCRWIPATCHRASESGGTWLAQLEEGTCTSCSTDYFPVIDAGRRRVATSHVSENDRRVRQGRSSRLAIVEALQALQTTQALEEVSGT